MLKTLSEDLGHRFGRGFSLTNLKQFRKFFLLYRDIDKGQTDSDQFAHLSYSRKGQTVSDLLKPGLPMNATPLGAQVLARRFPLPWSHYVQLLMEEALIHRLEHFLLELGSDFAFIGRQRMQPVSLSLQKPAGLPGLDSPISGSVGRLLDRLKSTIAERGYEAVMEDLSSPELIVPGGTSRGAESARQERSPFPVRAGGGSRPGSRPGSRRV